MNEIEDPDEICLNCFKKISSANHKCPFCGKVWWKNDCVCREIEDTNKREGTDSKAD